MADDAAMVERLRAELRELRKERETDRVEIECRDRAVAEALEQQTATAEVLRVIASSPTEQTRVLEAIASAAARLTESDGAAVQEVADEHLRVLAAYGMLATRAEAAWVTGTADRRIPFSRSTISGRSLLDRKTVHVPDVESAIETEFPASSDGFQRLGFQSLVSTPLVREDVSIGILVLYRFEPRPFTDRQIALLETFADQAVIAIENARLFEELEHRNAEPQESNRQVSEALEQQTATAEVLRAIAASPTGRTTVLEAIASAAVRLTESDGASVLQLVDDQRLTSVAEYGTTVSSDGYRHADDVGKTDAGRCRDARACRAGSRAEKTDGPDCREGKLRASIRPEHSWQGVTTPFGRDQAFCTKRLPSC